MRGRDKQRGRWCGGLDIDGFDFIGKYEGAIEAGWQADKGSGELWRKNPQTNSINYSCQYKYPRMGRKKR